VELLYPVVAGLDVHRDTVVVTIRKAQGRPKAWTETRTFSTFADGLQALSAWLDEHAVPLVAIESTGVMWKPVYRQLCQPGSRTVWLVNPMHCKAVPGRKTDVKDSEWLAQLAQFGLVMPSFVPGDAQLQLRELVRLRKQLVNEHSRQTNRIVRDLESQGIKLSSVLSDVLGKSGYAMVKALLAGDMSPEQIADLAVGKLRCKRAEIARAVQGKLNETARFTIGLKLELRETLDRQLQALDARIEQALAPMKQQVELLLEVPGLKHTVIAALLAEIGADMSVFRSADALASWAGLSPAACRSAGKSKDIGCRQGSHWVRIFLTQAAWAAAHTKATFWGRKFFTLAARIGRKQALIAIARKMLVTIYYMLRDGVPYRELGAGYTPAPNVPSRVRYHLEQLQQLGVDVSPLRTQAA
jgi:transposase